MPCLLAPFARLTGLVHDPDLIDRLLALRSLACYADSLAIISVDNPTSWLYRLLNLRALVVLGTLSYSLYIWHYLFLNDVMPQWRHLPTHAWNTWWSGATLVAVLSYRFLEMPLLQWRRSLRRT